MDFAIDTRGPIDNNDDIEIDLDVQEPIEDRDDEVMVDGASAAACDHPAYQNDADMLDEDYIENNPVDTEYSYQQPNESQYTDQDTYGTGNTYEAEMEDEYEEDIDAPIPGTNTLEFQDSTAKEVNHQLTQPSVPETSHERSKSPEQAKSLSPAPQSKSAQPLGSPAESEDPESRDKRGQATEDMAKQVAEEYYEESAEQDPERYSGETENARTQANEAGPSFESTENLERKDHSPPPEENVDYQSPQESIEESNLHSVKVLYQDNEISLFPPMEDDPTETYFIEDPALAHEPIGQVFHACRSVLNEHITEQEELVLDIESLNLHLSETASQHSSITLFQITKVYRDLCLNDRVSEPDPLYLTLSTRESFESTYHNLLQFVEDGKGLSSIHSWDEYEQNEAEGDSFIPDLDVTDASKSAAEGHADEAPVESSALESQEPELRENDGEKSVQLPDEQPEEDVTVVPASRSPAPEGVAHEESGPATSPQRDQSAEEAPNTEGCYSPDGVEQPDEVEGIDKISEPGNHEPQEYGASEEDYLAFSNEIHEGDGIDERFSTTNDIEEPREHDVEGEYSLPDNTNNAPRWSEGQERVKSPDAQDQPQEISQAEADGASREEKAYDYDAHDSYHPLGTGVPGNDDLVDIDVGRGEQPSREGDEGNHLEQDLDGPEIDISVENDGQLDHESDAVETGLPPKVEIEEAPRTPHASHELFDIEEDIFKSPVPKPVVTPPMDDSRNEFILQGTSQAHGQADVGTANGEAYRYDPDLESGEVSAYEEEEFQVGEAKLQPERSPTAAKRPRPDDEAGALEDSVPELKRHRSE